MTKGVKKGFHRSRRCPYERVIKYDNDSRTAEEEEEEEESRRCPKCQALLNRNYNVSADKGTVLYCRLKA